MKIHPDGFQEYQSKLKVGEMSFDPGNRGHMGLVNGVRAKPKAIPCIEGMAGNYRDE